MLDLIELGARAAREREAADEQYLMAAEASKLVAPRYTEALAEVERRADRALAQHTPAFQRFHEDCVALGLSHLPAESGTVAAYIEALRDFGATASGLRKELAAISYFHSELGFPDPAHDRLVEAIIYDAGKKPTGSVHGKH
jgi:hypothetical protein